MTHFLYDATRYGIPVRTSEGPALQARFHPASRRGRAARRRIVRPSPRQTARARRRAEGPGLSEAERDRRRKGNRLRRPRRRSLSERLPTPVPGKRKRWEAQIDLYDPSPPSRVENPLESQGALRRCASTRSFAAVRDPGPMRSLRTLTRRTRPAPISPPAQRRRRRDMPPIPPERGNIWLSPFLAPRILRPPRVFSAWVFPIARPRSNSARE